MFNSGLLKPRKDDKFIYINIPIFTQAHYPFDLLTKKLKGTGSYPGFHQIKLSLCTLISPRELCTLVILYIIVILAFLTIFTPNLCIPRGCSIIRHAEIAIFESPTPQRHALNHEKRVELP